MRREPPQQVPLYAVAGPYLEGALNRLIEYEWPGNVRQLKNEIERAVVLSQGRVIISQFLSLELGRAVSAINIAEPVRNCIPLETVLADVERMLVDEALQQSDGDLWLAASRLGLSLQDFNSKRRALMSA